MGNCTGGGWDTAIEAQDYVPGGGTPPKGRNSIFVDQSESIVSTIGTNYLQNFLSGGAVEKGVGVLTQKRFYYKGKNFSGAGKDTKSATEEGIVSIEDITFTKFPHFRHTGFLAFAVLLTLVGMVLMMTTAAPISFAILIAALPFYILYFVKRESMFLVAFPGGGFAFDIHWYPISDIQDFQRQLHLLKDYIYIKEERAA